MSDPQEPLGGAESTPDPTPFDRPDRSPSDQGAEELGGDDTVRANDELDEGVER
jgi:hypothetical protein